MYDIVAQNDHFSFMQTLSAKCCNVVQKIKKKKKSVSTVFVTLRSFSGFNPRFPINSDFNKDLVTNISENRSSIVAAGYRRCNTSKLYLGCDTSGIQSAVVSAS